jgi:hypothetical protein
MVDRGSGSGDTDTGRLAWQVISLLKMLVTKVDKLPGSVAKALMTKGGFNACQAHVT